MEEKKELTLAEALDVFAKADEVCYRLERELGADSPEQHATLKRLVALIGQKHASEQTRVMLEQHELYKRRGVMDAESHGIYLADTRQLFEHRKTVDAQNERIAVASERQATALEGILALLTAKPN